MLNKIIQFSIKNKLIVALFVIGLISWGIWNLTQLPIDAVPDITNNQVQVITTAPSQSAQDIERLVTFPIEQTMATIPGIIEIRSFSRFGLSSVTIVFKESIDIYWARQQVNERLSEARNQIPAYIGEPEIGPLTTGLGEIYQYMLVPKKGYENKYSITDLRVIQDWIIRRQLIGVPGVADVSSIGGYLKQYEISIDPDELRSYDLSLQDVFTALEMNNQNTGGAYIEKGPKNYFIRSEGLIGSIQDIESCVVGITTSGTPILIRDIGTVNIGHAPRYGALINNDKGEGVGAVVMMLKGENSNMVVNRVKQKMEQIGKTLPEGLEVQVFLDRSQLVNRAIGTVEKNLVEGALIVILVLILFLGNFRAGLIVASVIPLSMLFAISCMKVFGVSGNLMSLGAIDFGLIVDGAVIIVEATLHHLGMRKSIQRLSQDEMDEEVYSSASKIRNAAAFGEIIILIVYLPILALVGVEGKMFKPMAQTVGFAILGAFILSLTYVPMMSAFFLSKNIRHKETISDKMIRFLQRIYDPAIRFALRKKMVVISVSVLLFAISVFAFTRLGGEFLPTLEEGDFAVETRVLTGSSIQQTIDKGLEGAHILLTEFPDEVEKVVGKVGTGEVPTDPMPIEACDLIVQLKPKSKWKKAHTRDELATLMGTALEKIPGATFGFQQPIQMRFNELMTGVKQDVAIKIYGEDLNILTELSKEVASIVNTVEGATDLYVEEVTGLDQIVVTVNRDKAALYGVSIATINEAINTAFAGRSTGLVYEGEKRFDLVVRLDEESRTDIEDVKALFITTPKGEQVPLEQLATVVDTVNPNQIQRENAKRRIIVAFNVRGRDVASVVQELRTKVDSQIDFPAGYYTEYGGQFENLEAANKRLLVSVPVALLLIVMLLYFTFRSFKYSVLIFSSIPMSAIGGIFALLLRQMPFSISAGIGFIALFGVAVLNGIVLISEFNRLKMEGVTQVYERVLQGTRIRLRPVLMTATVASLGFLPMALATSAGAEVQKPLATVVIGGLISSTLLTLIVLPCLYVLIENKWKGGKRGKLTAAMILVVCTGAVSRTQAQVRVINADSVVAITRNNNKLIMAANSEIEYYRQVKLQATDMPKTNVMLMYGQYNSYATGDNNITVTQTIPFPTLFFARGSLGKAQQEGADLRKEYTSNLVIYEARQVYYQILYLLDIQELLKKQDTLYTNLLQSATVRFNTGDANMLDKTSAETMLNDIRNKLRKNAADLVGYTYQLKSYLSVQDSLVFKPGELNQLELQLNLDSQALQNNPYLQVLKQEIEIARKQKGVTVNTILPDITVGYFNQTLYGTALDGGVNPNLATYGNRFQGFQVGLSIPLWIGPHVSKVKADKSQVDIATYTYEHNEDLLQGEYRKAIQAYIREQDNLDYYRNSALINAELLLKNSSLSYTNGDISYMSHLLNIQQALTLQSDYLKALNDYNQSILYLDLLTGKY